MCFNFGWVGLSSLGKSRIRKCGSQEEPQTAKSAVCATLAYPPLLGTYLRTENPCITGTKPVETPDQILDDCGRLHEN